MSTMVGPEFPDGDTAGLKRRSVRGAAMAFVSQGLRFVLQIGSQIVLARLLLPSEFGLIAMITPLLSFVQIFNELGLTQATVQRAKISHEELSTLFWVNVGISVGLAAAVCLAAPLVALFYGEPRLTLVTICMAGLLVLSGLSAQQMAIMNRSMRFLQLSVIDFTCLAVAVAAGIGAAWYGMGYWSLVVMQAANSLTITVLSWAMSDWRPLSPRKMSSVGSLLRFGGHVTGYNVLSFAGANLDSVLIGVAGGSHTLGLYDRAQRLVSTPVWHIGGPIARVAVALLSRLNDQHAHYRRAYVQMLQVLLLAMVPGFVAAAMVSERLVPALFGPAWTEAAPIVTWLAVAVMFAPFGLSTYWLFVSQGRVGQQLAYGGLRTALTLAALMVGLPWGVVGVAQSYAAFAILVQGSLVWGATRHGPVRWHDVVRGAYPVAVGALAAAGALLLTERYVPGGLMHVGVRLMADVLLSYAACGLVLLFFPDGQRLLRSLWDLRSTFRPAPNAG